jgi:putative iron-regulated protein
MFFPKKSHKVRWVVFSLLGLGTVSLTPRFLDRAHGEDNAFVKDYANLASFSYSQALRDLLDFQREMGPFLASPSSSSLDLLKQAFVKARLSYGATEVFRFSEGPIDNSVDGPEGRMNAWPIDESYIDYVESDPSSGIINTPSRYPQITGELLTSLNELGGEQNISTGFHAIEFLLWGQDRFADSAGNREWKDFTTLSGARPNGIRRAEYLRVVTQLLVSDLSSITKAWDLSQPGSYGTSFVSLDPKVALKKILDGSGTLAFGEMAGERMFVSIDEQDQEHEHSCFSDLTHLDHEANLVGIQNVLTNTYSLPKFRPAHGEKWTIGWEKLHFNSGKGLISLLEETQPSLAQKWKNSLIQAEKTVGSIPAPFDVSLLEGSQGIQKIRESIETLRTLGFVTQEAGSQWGVEVQLGVGD